MKKIFLLLLLAFPGLAFCQKGHKSYKDSWDKWDWVTYGNDVAYEQAKNAESNCKKYFVDKMIAFKKHCENDSILYPVTDWAKVFRADTVCKKAPLKYYLYKHPEPTFEYFIEWLQKNK